ncbi:MAG: nuclear transport factor 2 family protein [Solirubrobacteraceae bacterium]
MTVQEWADAYKHAWETKDPEAAARLFTEDSVYHDQPFGEPHIGQRGVHEYWASVTETQDDVHVALGKPIASADGRDAAVEFWVMMQKWGAETTLTGILVLKFAADGRCQVLREAWHFNEGRQEPYPGWGE